MTSKDRKLIKAARQSKACLKCGDQRHRLSDCPRAFLSMDVLLALLSDSRRGEAVAS